MIDSINANSSSISDTIQQECANVGYTLSETMNSIWTNDGGAFTVISKYGDQFLTQNTSTLNAILGIKAYTDALIAKADAEAKAKAEATKKQTEASKPASQPSKPSNNTHSTPSNRHEPIRITMVLLLLFGTVTMVGELEIPELAVCKLKVLMPIEFKVS